MADKPQRFRYEPADNRTPLLHPVIGELVYGQEYTHPDCAFVPGMVDISDEAGLKAAPVNPSQTAVKGVKPKE